MTCDQGLVPRLSQGLAIVAGRYPGLKLSFQWSQGEIERETKIKVVVVWGCGQMEAAALFQFSDR